MESSAPAPFPEPSSAAAPAAAPLSAADLSNGASNGAFALALIAAQTERLRRLRPEVLADAEREPLHQLRVSLRRLRTALRQFGPALVLPERVSERRIAALARRTSLCRDLDVLRDLLEHAWLPRLPAAERRALQPLLRRLRHRRRRAFLAAAEELQARRCERLLARLEAWAQRPGFTALGEEPLAVWRTEWHRPFTGTLFLHPGWWASHPQDPSLHDLRKRIKGVRYSLEPLLAPLEVSVQAWIGGFKQAQSALGALQDLQVLAALLQEAPPGLAAELERQRVQAWAQWGEVRALLLRPECRRALPGLNPWPEPAAAGEAEPAAAGS